MLENSDGKTVGACLDRNGLRPARYWRTVDNVVYVASEVCIYLEYVIQFINNLVEFGH